MATKCPNELTWARIGQRSVKASTSNNSKITAIETHKPVLKHCNSQDGKQSYGGTCKGDRAKVNSQDTPKQRHTSERRAKEILRVLFESFILCVEQKLQPPLEVSLTSV